MLTINGVQMPPPSALQVDIATIDGNTTRNARGEMIRDVIATKRKLNLEWKHLSESDISRLLKAIDKPFFTVSYPDPMEGKIITKTFYVGDRSVPVYQVKQETKIVDNKPTIVYHPVWVNIKFNFVEK